MAWKMPGVDPATGRLTERGAVLWGSTGAGTLAYGLLLLLLYGKTRQDPNYWFKRGWQLGRKGKNWKKPMQGCLNAMLPVHAGPQDVAAGMELCGSLLASGHAAGKEGVPLDEAQLR